MEINESTIWPSTLQIEREQAEAEHHEIVTLMPITTEVATINLAAYEAEIESIDAALTSAIERIDAALAGLEGR